MRNVSNVFTEYAITFSVQNTSNFQLAEGVLHHQRAVTTFCELFIAVKIVNIVAIFVEDNDRHMMMMMAMTRLIIVIILQ